MEPEHSQSLKLCSRAGQVRAPPPTGERPRGTGLFDHAAAARVSVVSVNWTSALKVEQAFCTTRVGWVLVGDPSLSPWILSPFSQFVWRLFWIRKDK